MSSHELLHFVVEVVYLVQRVVFVLHPVGFGACVDLAFQGERIYDGVVALFAAVEKPIWGSFFFGRVNDNALKNHPSFANEVFLGIFSCQESPFMVSLWAVKKEVVHGIQSKSRK